MKFLVLALFGGLVGIGLAFAVAIALEWREDDRLPNVEWPGW